MKKKLFIQKSSKNFLILLLNFILLTTLIIFSPLRLVYSQDNNYDYEASLDPWKGSVGSTVTITGTNWPPNVALTFYFGDWNRVREVTIIPISGSTRTNNNGNFTSVIIVPNFPEDQYFISVTDGVRRTWLGFPITVPLLAPIVPTSGPVGTAVEIVGKSFVNNKDIEIEYDGDEIDIEDGDDETDSSGEFESVIYIPESTAGDHTITVIVGSAEVEAEFTVEPEILIKPQSGASGTEVTVSGTGFGSRKEVDIYFNNIQVTTSRADNYGSFSATFIIPEFNPGTCIIEAEDEDTWLGTVAFTLVAPPPEPAPEPTLPPTPPQTPTQRPHQPVPSPTQLQLSQESASVGAQLMVGGAGFNPNAKVSVKYDDKEVSTATADAQGVFIAAFKVPSSRHGDHVITASDGTNTNEITFTVKSTKIETPMPLLPEMGVKVKPPVSLDWEDVSAESTPVTYTLQIAIDEDFPAGSIVLEKKDLTRSEYVLTEREELIFQEFADHPYYWRIKATDAAQNESDWTGVGEFYIQGSSTPIWLWIIIIIMICALAIVFWFLFRKRGAVEKLEKPAPQPRVRVKPEPATATPVIPPPSKEENNYAAEVVCSKCGGANRSSASFCAHCGASLEVARTCPKCKFLNRPGATFCGSCGKSLQDE